MSLPRYASIHVVGLGGTGANVIQSIIEGEKFLKNLSSEDLHLSFLAIDIADGDIEALQDAYKRFTQKMSAQGIPLDRIWLKTVKIRFSTPDALFEFISRYDKILSSEGVYIENYRPWVHSAITIPPLAGGVGRQRALSKAIFLLNYYYYEELSGIIASFKDRVLTSRYTPVIAIVFGLGGGTGSGLIFDFARHLRSRLGTAVPIIGFAVLPSSADDYLARGPAPYTAQQELELLMNSDLNQRVGDIYGNIYRNPFNAFFFIALEPVYNAKNNLVEAKKNLDEMLSEMLNLLSHFDLADLMSRVGTNNIFGPNWVHAMGYLKIRYPVDGYIKYQKDFLTLLERIGGYMAIKRELVEKIRSILDAKLQELVEIFRLHLAEMGSYNPETFESEVEELIRRGGRYEIDLKAQVRALQDFVSYYNTKYVRAIKAIKFPEDKVEHGVVKKVEDIASIMSNIVNTYDNLAEISLEDIEQGIISGRGFTVKQSGLLRSYLNLVKLVLSGINAIKSYLRAKALAEELLKRYGKSQIAEAQLVRQISEVELNQLFSCLQTLLSMPDIEAKTLDQAILGLRILRKNLEDRYKDREALVEHTRRLISQKEVEEKQLREEIRGIKIDLSGRRRKLEKQLAAVQSEIQGLRTRLSEQEEDMEKSKKIYETAKELVSGIEVTSEYRKYLAQITSTEKEINTLMSEITKTAKFYERVVELSEAEQIRIMEKILKEEESALQGEGVLNEIVDRDRFRATIDRFIRILSIPTQVGLTNNFRTDLIWVTISIPEKLWDQDLQMKLVNTLAPNLKIEASKGITVRQIPQVDPWTISILVIFAKARIEDIEMYQAMKRDAGETRKAERILFRSYLLEHWNKDIEELRILLETKKETEEVKEAKR
jgi:predicted  nucleic acid-binding Zn-ribbon protein